MTPLHVLLSLCLLFRVVASFSGGFTIAQELSSNGDPAYGWDGTFDNLKSEKGVSLCRLYVRLNRNVWLTPTSPVLVKLPTIFSRAVASNVGLVLRFFYDDGEPQSVAHLTNDLHMIIPVINRHKKAIFILQAGFLGASYGEWWGGRFAPDTDREATNTEVRQAKKIVVDMLKTTGLPVAIRYPRDLANYYPDDPHVGLHDDCILSQGVGGADSGTFDKGSILWRDGDLTSAQRFSRERVQGLVGGESCDDAVGASAPTCEQLLTFVKDYRLSYFNIAWPSRINQYYQSYKKGDNSPDAQCLTKVRAALEANYHNFTSKATHQTQAPSSSPSPSPSSSPSSSPTPRPTPRPTSRPTPRSTPHPTPSPTSSSGESVMGCWASDQEASERCLIAGCPSQYCTQEGDKTPGHECRLLRAPFCAQRASNTEILGCWAADQRAIEKCTTTGCSAQYCTQSSDKTPGHECRLLRAPFCAQSTRSLKMRRTSMTHKSIRI